MRCKSKLEQNSTQYWLISSNDLLLKAVLAHFEHFNPRNYKILTIHDAFSDLLTPLRGCGKNIFQTRCTTGQTRSCFPILILYSCDIPEANGKLAFKYGFALHSTWLGYLTTTGGLWSLSCGRSGTFPVLDLAKSSVRSQAAQLASRCASHISKTAR